MGIRIASLWSPKAKQWCSGRKQFPSFKNTEKTVWMHCASLGEFEQGRPVLEAIKKKHPHYKIALSFFSPSGYEIRKHYAGADQIFYLPIDSPQNAKKLIDNINPCLVIWVKYEYWYFYLSALKNRGIPVLLVSAIFRKSQPFFKWHGAFWRKLLGAFDHIFVQNEASKNLLKNISIDQQVTISGDTRFDRVISIADSPNKIEAIEAFICGRKTLVVGSTWPDDEKALFDFIKKNNEIAIIIAPHEISASHLSDLKNQFNNPIFYSDWLKNQKNESNCNVLIIDNIGMLSSIYPYATVTYIGGGFNKSGIHNTLEAAVYGKPVVFGPVYEKFAEAKKLVELGGAFSFQSTDELQKILYSLFNDVEKNKTAGLVSKNYVFEKKGATAKILNYIEANRLLTN